MKAFTEYRPVWILSLALALSISGHLIVFSISSLAALEMGASTQYATLPYFFGFLGALITTLPLSLAMSRMGRRPWFIFGSFAAGVGALVMAWGYNQSSLAILCIGQMIFGIQMATGFFYRFAVLELAPKGREQRSLGFLFFSGVFAALLGPNLAQWTQGWHDKGYLGSYLVLVGVYLCIAIAVSFLPKGARVISLQPIPWKKALHNRAILIAMSAGMSSYAIMTLLMGVTPMAMQHHHFHFAEVTLVVQWHMLGMFLPGPLTGRLLEKWGHQVVLALGGLFYLACFSISFIEPQFWSFWSELVLLGLGWNFSYLAATGLLQKSLRPGEEGIGQGFNELAILSLNTLVAFGSGHFFANLGWINLHWFILPLVIPLFWVGFWTRKS